MHKGVQAMDHSPWILPWSSVNQRSFSNHFMAAIQEHGQQAHGGLPGHPNIWLLRLWSFLGMEQSEKYPLVN
jgi:hypothetical protein